MDKEAGMKLSGWTMINVSNGELKGGLSSTLEDASSETDPELLKEDVERMKTFCRNLFSRAKLPNQLQYFLLCSIF